uniref:Uncharacterized protein n=1 Tax=Anguilla anguilla TaxID=7936 RepID=A0A0E9RGJ5_ANGAN
MGNDWGAGAYPSMDLARGMKKPGTGYQSIALQYVFQQKISHLMPIHLSLTICYLISSHTRFLTSIPKLCQSSSIVLLSFLTYL